MLKHMKSLEAELSTEQLVWDNNKEIIKGHYYGPFVSGIRWWELGSLQKGLVVMIIKVSQIIRSTTVC